jgi:ubiquinone/menaquinone biosynthesis C-methylase UbiE
MVFATVMQALMQVKNFVPWRLRHRVDRWLEKSIRPGHPKLYKLVKFGRTNLNTPDYWDNVWRADTTDRNYSELFAAILERIPEGARVLDVGCGVGRLSRRLRDERRARVTGLDFSRWACEQLAKDGFETMVSTLPTIPFPDGAFDAAVATEVLEHLDRPAATIREMARVVRPGGTLICSVPDNALHPHEELEHQHTFTEKTARALFASIAATIETTTGAMPGHHDYVLVVARLEH